MKKKITFCTLLLFLSTSYITIYSRSVHRPQDPLIPQITARWPGSTQTYTIKDSHLEEYPIFKTNAKECKKWLLPKNDTIAYSNDPNKYIDTKKMNALIEQLVNEIQNHQRTFTDFTIITTKDFNFKKLCGLIILQFNDHPFVLKLNMERPETFVNPYCKGMIPMFFFFMGGGSNRHIIGLTRIKNLKIVKNKIAAHPYWTDHVKMPRKWFWLPSDDKWFEVKGKNIGNKETLTTQFPSIYGTIADRIEIDKDLPIPNKEKGKQIMKLANDLDLYIDPNRDNFVFQTDPITKKTVIVIIDTEHFPTIVGIKDARPFNSHAEWYTRLSRKALKDMFFRTKSERRAIQKAPPSELEIW